MKKVIFILFSALILSSCNNAEKTAEDVSGSISLTEPETKASETSESPKQTEEILVSEAETPEDLEEAETTNADQEIFADITEILETVTIELLGSYNKWGENNILVTTINNEYWGLMPCYGTLGSCEKYSKSVNKFKEKLPKVNVYSMVIPTSVEFYMPDAYKNNTASQKKKIDYIEEKLVNVKNVDAYSALEKNKDKPIFARTDHHWQPLGGYYAAEQFAKEAEVPFPTLDEYKKVVRSSWVGSMYNYSKDINLKNNPEDFVMYMPNGKTKTTYYNASFKNGYSGNLFVTPNGSSFYCSFLGADNVIAKVETEVENDRTLVIFKESYGNALVPFLTNSFKTIYVCDMRYFDLNAVRFCKDIKATDLLFASCTFTPAGANGNHLQRILNL